ncbi:tumor necrosis factor receptor superfamily member 19 [Anoxybacillus vitaminiphilus]|uniref:Tumor necrosis factor receptor superfamily member 19 n=1 Tax=Paranoxybacillus vitaminiphilus TaxID=581036 RepID=A0A327YN19_9BACL|nr:YtzI protein [Anoxybacillus vitaminiphilus]RAK21095.1 tumor necrosis factor receptor superfamily member 19 [Anoxybacillus vitaminiphilus]
MFTILIISIIIVLIVLVLSVATTSKAYKYKHTIDSLDNNPHLQNKNDNTQENNDKSHNK